MKFIFIILSFFILNTSYADSTVYAEPPFDAEEYVRNPHPPQTSNVNTVVDDVLNLILDQGFAGAIIVVLLGWTFRVDKANRAEQKENTAKFETLSKECSKHMEGVSVKLENLEREVEQFKQLEILRKS